MYQLNQSPGRNVVADGKEYLFFSGYSYLGMSHVPAFMQLVKEGMDRFGLLQPSSRISNTQLLVYKSMEEVLSKLLAKPDTVTFGSGYLAGRAITDLLQRHYNNIYTAPCSHPAIQCGTQLHGNDWKTSFVHMVNTLPENQFVLCMDGVNAIAGQVANFSFLHEIKPSKKIICVVDDSHGVGVFGAMGCGTIQLIPQLPNVEVVLTYSLSKAFHINGGAVSCSSPIALLLRSAPFYTASTPIAPAMAYAFVNGQYHYHCQQSKLQENITMFTSIINELGAIGHYPHLPIFVLKPHWITAGFDKNNIIISSFAYPTPASKLVNRVVLNALHTRHDLYKLFCTLQQLHRLDMAS